jgi:glucosamine-6-phosphate deaminase
MQGELRPYADSATASRILAAEIAREIRSRATASQPGLVLGLPTGGSPLDLYRELIRLHRQEGLSFASVRTFNLDEYWPAPAGDSFAEFMALHLFSQVNLPAGQAHILNGKVPEPGIEKECARYEEQIRAAGGIDVLILGLGVNGHLAFNEPGSAPDSRTRRVRLASETLARARQAQPGVEPCREALTLGLGNILEARRIAVLAFGAAKAEAVRQALRGPESADCPATFLRRHARVEWFTDPAAAAGL